MGAMEPLAGLSAETLELVGYHPGIDLFDDVAGALQVVVDRMGDAAGQTLVLVVGDSPPHFDGPPSDPLWGLQFIDGDRASVVRRTAPWRQVCQKLRDRAARAAWVWPMVAATKPHLATAARAERIAAKAFRTVAKDRETFLHIAECKPPELGIAVAEAFDALVHTRSESSATLHGWESFPSSDENEP